jgi:hypothetical protein
MADSSRPLRPADEMYERFGSWGKSFTSPLLFPSPCAIRGSLLYSLVLGGTQAQLGITQTQEGPYAKSPTSRAHLVQGAEPL